MEKMIYQSILNVMEDLEPIGKDKWNQQGFNYRGVDDVMNALQPLLVKHGVSIVPTVLSHQREQKKTSGGGVLLYSICTMKYTFYAKDGSSIEAVVVGEGMDSGDKATNKAMSVAFKYACFQVFCIPTEEMVDPDAESPDIGGKNPKQPKSKPRKPGALICGDCGTGITQGVYNFSMKEHEEPLCMNCQEKRKQSA